MSVSQPPDSAPVLRLEWDVEDGLLSGGERALVESAVAGTVAGRWARGPLLVGLAVVLDEEIRELNRSHRGIDSATDVLSFPLVEFESPGQPRNLFPVPPGEPVNLGDLVISYERALEQARDYGHSPEREIAYLAVHGTLHLLGYDHESNGDRAVMRRQEEYVLDRMGLSRGGEDETSA